jgi:hypothetical protein
VTLRIGESAVRLAITKTQPTTWNRFLEASHQLTHARIMLASVVLVDMVIARISAKFICRHPEAAFSPC